MYPNKAAWLTAPFAVSLEVKPAEYTSPLEKQFVIRNRAIAINPIDWAIQAKNVFPWMIYPAILGEDVAGEVVEVGTGVTRFKIGDRVVGLALGVEKNGQSTPEGAFQAYVVLREHLASLIPDTLSYENACVLPLGLSTAATGLFLKDYLALTFPSLNPEPTGKTLLVWGGATSVGSNAIQLAVAAGYEIITTASPKNFDYVKRLGATQVFDYHNDSIIEQLVEAFNGKESAGAFAIGSPGPTAGLEVATACFEVIARVEGVKFVALVTPGAGSRPENMGAKFIFGSDLKDFDVAPAIYSSFLPQALAQRKYFASPEPLVIGHGLESIQMAFEIQKKGVSARKVVVSL